MTSSDTYLLGIFPRTPHMLIVSNWVHQFYGNCRALASITFLIFYFFLEFDFIGQ